MKWGVRRFQNKNGKLTSRGKKRYSAETERAREAYKESKSQRRKAYIDWNKKSLGGIIVRQEDIDELGRSMNKEKVYKNRYKESKDRDRMREIDAIKGKSKRRTELEKKVYEERYGPRGCRISCLPESPH